MSEMSPMKYFICGGFAGLFNAVFGHPMDTVKVRLQTMPPPKPGEAPLYAGTADCLRKIILKEGFAGLFKGITAPLVAVAPTYALNFFGFSLGKKLMKSDVNHVLSKPELFASGSFSGVLTSFVMAPGDRIKCLLQIQQDTETPKYKGTFDCVKKLYAEGGIRSIYRGTVVTIVRDIPAAGVFFLSYESVKELVMAQDSSDSMLATVFAGGCAGMCYGIVAMPADVLKSRLQTASEGRYPKGVRDVFKEMMKREGPRALFTGMTPVMLRAFPANAATFGGFELTAKILDWIALRL